jgi:hypothetical protein
MKTMRSKIYSIPVAVVLGIAIGYFVGFVSAIHWALNISPWQAAHDLWYSLVDGSHFR